MMPDMVEYKTWPRPLYQHLLFTQMHIKGMTADFTALAKQQGLSNLPDLDHPDWQQFMQAVTTYQTRPRTQRCETDICWHNAETSLAYYAPPNPSKPNAQPVLFIPSLINRSHILDLYKDRSLVRWLADKDYHVYLLDWGTPQGESLSFTIEDYIEKRLLPALDFICQQHGGVKTHIAGFCMGGLLAMAAAQLRPEQAQSLALLATPWDFHAPDPASALQFTRLYDALKPAFNCRDYVPIDMVQTLFLSLDPFVSFKKFMKFMTMNETEQAHFTALEDWANDGVPLSLPVAEQAVYGWYRDNQTQRKAWHISDKIISPENLHCPVFAATPQKDRLVRYESSNALVKSLEKIKKPVTAIQPNTGHTAMIVSDQAKTTLWQPFHEWLTAQKP